ncbi:sugar ABC transporter substrate-binding protein [Bacillus sp. 7586-K]|uniref:ABC-type glycerol-3-phosphate transport system substrate-binding protein n=1 Tax=Metabacillus niabensis TaxID=324854 RepID=A0ABT9YZH7_9BACI|nr:extracellular solute-binding protein [Metabacillus niabensis]MDQ0225389.1 ABC-type glycerol-3-phosphate transport system substrate-binding protein [Metabacillus niabensis]PAD70963.1 sugar ABC transporter substrate-binding protein [Bacillus sp. 7586-K]
MKKGKLLSLLMVMMLVVLAALSGCGNNKEGSNSEGGTQEADTSWKDKDPKDIKGEITVINQRTDIIDTVFPEYEKEFQKKYPNVEVNFEALTDYGGQITPRMNTQDYGDVLLIPTQVPIKDIPNFFEPLGKLEDMEKDYMGVEERAVDGTVYGIPIAVTYTGVVYNKKVFEEAGITETPKTMDDFLAALQKIKDNTDAIPLYTNYAAGWPLTQWEGAFTTVAGDAAYYNQTMVNEKDPFVKGKPQYELWKLMYDVANKDLIEEDPLTTDWETSKAMIGKGEIGTMVLGSWAIDQIKSVSENPDDIGYMPFPTNADKVIFPLGADFQIGVNKNSENKEAALAWVDWFIHESGYSVEQAGGISAAKDVPLPEELKQYEEQGVTFELLTPAKEGQEGLLDKIDKEAEVGLWLEDTPKRIVEAAIGNRDESFDDIMKELNADWNEAYDKVTAE